MEDFRPILFAFYPTFSSFFVDFLQQAKKNLTKVVKEAAAKASETAVKSLITPPLKSGIRSDTEKDVVPDVKSEAKRAANAEVKCCMLTNKKHDDLPAVYLSKSSLVLYK